MMYLSVTFDYELFFGKNHGSYDEVLFRPTYDLIDLLEQKGISATFFADVCSVPLSQKYNQNEYAEGFAKQIQYMAKHGQDVQLHLHPHWFFSSWENGQWTFSNKGYRLHEFVENGKLDRIISEGIQYLNDTIKLIDPHYECIAYRAGGFSLQPHEKIVSSLYDQGIRVDSSVAPQLVAKAEANFYDYKHALEKMNWYISSEDEWWKDSREGKYLFEIPVATIDKNPVSFLLKRLFKADSIKMDLGAKRGSYISGSKENESRLKAYYKYISGYNAISMDAYAAGYLFAQVERLYKKMKCEDQVVAIIGHPKLVNETYINNLGKFIDLVKKDQRFRFVSVCDAYLMKEKTSGNKKEV